MCVRAARRVPSVDIERGSFSRGVARSQFRGKWGSDLSVAVVVDHRRKRGHGPRELSKQQRRSCNTSRSPSDVRVTAHSIPLLSALFSSSLRPFSAPLNTRLSPPASSFLSLCSALLPSSLLSGVCISSSQHVAIAGTLVFSANTAHAGAAVYARSSSDILVSDGV
eukprot:2324876-Rhodomonas_salina.1